MQRRLDLHWRILIDPRLDLCRTTVNVFNDTCVAVVAPAAKARRACCSTEPRPTAVQVRVATNHLGFPYETPLASVRLPTDRITPERAKG